jgi:hypothetical protein
MEKTLKTWRPNTIPVQFVLKKYLNHIMTKWKKNCGESHFKNTEHPSSSVLHNTENSSVSPFAAE